MRPSRPSKWSAVKVQSFLVVCSVLVRFHSDSWFPLRIGSREMVSGCELIIVLRCVASGHVSHLHVVVACGGLCGGVKSVMEVQVVVWWMGGSVE